MGHAKTDSHTTFSESKGTSVSKSSSIINHNTGTTDINNNIPMAKSKISNTPKVAHINETIKNPTQQKANNRRAFKGDVIQNKKPTIDIPKDTQRNLKKHTLKKNQALKI